MIQPRFYNGDTLGLSSLSVFLVQKRGVIQWGKGYVVWFRHAYNLLYTSECRFRNWGFLYIIFYYSSFSMRLCFFLRMPRPFQARGWCKEATKIIRDLYCFKLDKYPLPCLLNQCKYTLHLSPPPVRRKSTLSEELQAQKALKLFSFLASARRVTLLAGSITKLRNGFLPFGWICLDDAGSWHLFWGNRPCRLNNILLQLFLTT